MGGTQEEVQLMAPELTATTVSRPYRLGGGRQEAGPVLSALSWINWSTPHNNFIVIPILQMRERRHREVKKRGCDPAPCPSHWAEAQRPAGSSPHQGAL